MRPNDFWRAGGVRALCLEALWLAVPILVFARDLRAVRDPGAVRVLCGGGGFRCR